jgi:hypothetical protein
MFPPMLLYVRVSPHGNTGHGVWLPLFLVWLILLPIVVLVLAVTIVVDALLWLAGQSYHHYTLLLVRCLGMLGATRGTVVSIRSEEAVVDINLA